MQNGKVCSVSNPQLSESSGVNLCLDLKCVGVCCFFFFYLFPLILIQPVVCTISLQEPLMALNVTRSTFFCFKSTFFSTFCVLMQGWKPIKCTEENILQPGWIRCAAVKSTFWASKLRWELLISIFSSCLNIQSFTWAVGGQCRLLFEWSIVINRERVVKSSSPTKTCRKPLAYSLNNAHWGCRGNFTCAAWSLISQEEISGNNDTLHMHVMTSSLSEILSEMQYTSSENNPRDASCVGQTVQPVHCCRHQWMGS